MFPLCGNGRIKGRCGQYKPLSGWLACPELHIILQTFYILQTHATCPILFVVETPPLYGGMYNNVG